VGLGSATVNSNTPDMGKHGDTLVKKYKHHGHPFQRWLNTSMHKHALKAEVLAALSGCNHASILDWRKGASFPKLIPFWGLCRAFALVERTSPETIANNVLPYFNRDTRDPSTPIWK